MGYFIVILISGICLSGYFVGVDATIGDNCTVLENCTAVNHEVCATDVCACDAAYNDIANAGTCALTVLGDPCATNLACAAIPDAICDTVSTATCVCSTSYKDDGTGEACVPKEIGDSCFVTPQCSVIANAICEDMQCICDTGYAANGGVCEQILCDPLAAPTDGGVDTSGGFTIGSVAVFSCDVGYDPDSPVNVNCLDDGIWDTSTHTCTIKECPALTQPTSGTAVLDSGDSGPATYLDTATYACNAGYSPDNPLTTTCLEDGNWDTVHTCTIKNCSSVLVTHGTFTGGTEYNNVATFGCDAGYSPDTAMTTTCQSDETWTVPSHNCTIKDCGPVSVTDGTLTGGTLYNEDATFGCDTGYSPDATVTTTCQANGTWSVTSHSCAIKDCRSPDNQTHGTTALDDATSEYGATATLTCDEGYNVGAASTTITCESSGSWTATPTCSLVGGGGGGCGTPTPPDDGSINLAGGTGATHTDDTATVTCSVGFGLSTNESSTTITCQNDNSWSTIPSCTVGDAADCGDPTAPDDGTVSLSTPTVTTEGHEATVDCDSGYTLDGEDTITCQHDGQWSDAGTCESGAGAAAGSVLLVIIVGIILRLAGE